MSVARATEASRLDVALVAAGLATSRTRAAKAVAAGRVSVDGLTVTRASAPVPADAELTLEEDAADRYVGRAAHKLLGALEAFPDVVVQDRECLDAGASTGGFTQVLLERGARHVLAVDVGHGQLHPTIAGDDRVENREGVNVRDLGPQDVPTGVDLVVGDLSFISLRLVVGPLASVVRQDGELLLMVKPQFEVGRHRLSRTGVVVDPAAREEAVRQVLSAATDAGLVLLGAARSPLAGQDGNVEFFLRFRRPTPGGTPQRDADLERIVAGLTYS